MTGSTAITPSMRRIRCTAPGLADLSYLPGQDLMLSVPASGGTTYRRRYTIRSFEPEVPAVDLDMVLHGDGPGALLGGIGAAGSAHRGHRAPGQGDRRPQRRLAPLRRRRLRPAGQPGHGRVPRRTGPGAGGPGGRRRGRPAAGPGARGLGGSRAVAPPGRCRPGVGGEPGRRARRPWRSPPEAAMPIWPASSAWWPPCGRRSWRVASRPGRSRPSPTGGTAGPTPRTGSPSAPSVPVLA